MRVFASLSKIEEQEDGSIKVFGIASTGARDDAGEIVHPDAMKEALPDYMKWGAIREMHQPKAAGTAVEARVDEDGCTQLVAHVVDADAVNKARTGVYKGFSIGGKVLKRDPKDPTVITAIKLIETSLVDRPCNPEASINMWKAADIADPEGADMSAYNPSNEEVKAKAEEMAKAAGKPGRKNDYLSKAREELIEAHAAANPGESQGEGAEENLGKAEQPVAEGQDGSAKPDPAEALSKALEAAEAAKSASPVLIVEDGADGPVTPGLADLGKQLVALGKASEGDGLAKGFYMVGVLAEAVAALVALQECAAWEEMTESKAQLADAAQAAGKALQTYVMETVAGALSTMDTEVIVVELAAGADPLAAELIDTVKADTALMEKAGKRNSTRDQKHIQDAHDSAVKAGAQCDKGNCPEDDAEKAALVAENERLSKVLVDAAPQVESLTKALTDQGEVLKTALADIALLKAQPLPPKTAGSSLANTNLGNVTKTADADGLGSSDAPVAPTKDAMEKWFAGLSDDERVELSMKAAMARPIAIGR